MGLADEQMYHTPAQEGCLDTETKLFTKKGKEKRNEKGNLEDDSASHRHSAHCTLYFTRSYELHAVHVETGKLNYSLKKLFELWVSK